MSSKKIVNLLVFIVIISSIGDEFTGIGRYLIKYGAIIGCLYLVSFAIAKRKYKCVIDMKWSKGYKYWIFILIIGTFIFNMINGRISNRFTIELFIIVVPLILVMLICKFINSNNEILSIINTVFFACTIIFIITNINKLTIGNLLALDIIHSYSPFESDLCSYFAMIFIWYFISGDKKWILSAIFMILTGKRMSIAGSFLVLVIYYLLNNVQIEVKKYHLALISIINLLIVKCIIFMTTDSAQTIFLNKFGLSLNSFTMGRVNMFRLFENNSLFNKNGLGSTTEFLMNYSSDFGVLHSDLLKIYYEFGTVLFIGIIFCMYLPALKNKNYKVITYIIYTNILFIMNHNLDYIIANFIFYLFIALSFNENKIFEIRGGEKSIYEQ